MHPPKLILCNTQSLADGTQVIFKMNGYWICGIWEDFLVPEGGVVISDLRNEATITLEELPDQVFRIVH